MHYTNMQELIHALDGVVDLGEREATLLNKRKLTDELLEKLAFSAVFSPEETKKQVRWILWELAQKLNILPTSNHDFYMARGRNEYTNLTVPSINVRMSVYHTARAVFRAAIKNNVGAFQFELARSEIGYTAQRPAEYTACLLAAAIREGYKGPLFILGDHFQANSKKYKSDPEKEVNVIKNLIKESISAGWYCIDVDTSTLVDLDKDTLDAQQKVNYELSAQLTQYTRHLQPEGITIGIGAEIGEVGKKNSTPEELKTFMNGYNNTLKKMNPNLTGICRISIQTGTSHGGVVLPDGTLKEVSVDFDTLCNLSKIAREEYGLAGAVQHGASTLPDSAFSLFPKNEACEVHLATGFQNIIYDHELFPPDLKEKMYQYIKENHSNERKEGQTDEQFIYKLRKKALGPYKREIWDLPKDTKTAMGKILEDKFTFLFKQLNVFDTKELVDRLVKPIRVKKYKEDFTTSKVIREDSKGLDD